MKTAIEMAKEAGFSLYRDISAVDGSIANLERFAELVAAAENEACEKLAEMAEPYQAADLIRARRKK